MADRDCEVSVIIPFYNAGRFLADAIASVVAQSFTDWELILVDDGSTDNGPGIARRAAAEMPHKVRVLTHPGGRNRGMCTSRNLGIRNSAGAFIALLDADDTWLPHKLQQQVTMLRQYPQAGLLYGRSEYWYDDTVEDTPSKPSHVPSLVPAGLYTPPTLLKLCYPLGSAGAPCPSDFLLRREALERVGGFEESFDRNAVMEDQAFLAKIYLAVPVLVAESCWDRYRCHALSCCAADQRAGNSQYSLRFYLTWLRAYLNQAQVRDPVIWAAVARKIISAQFPVVGQTFHKLRQATRRALAFTSRRGQSDVLRERSGF